MPSVWIVTKTNPALVEAFQQAEWEVEVFAPPDLVLASQSRVSGLDVIIFEVTEAAGPFFDKFKELCQDKLAPILAVVPNWAFADLVSAAGADAVIVMPVNLSELLWRARDLVRAKNVVHVGELAIDLAAMTVKRGGHLIHLPPLEYRLLACLAERIGQAVSHDDILLYVWQYHPKWGGTLEQVKTCVKRLRQAIEPDPHHPQYIITIRRVGYQLRNQAQWQAATRSS